MENLKKLVIGEVLALLKKGGAIEVSLCKDCYFCTSSGSQWKTNNLMIANGSLKNSLNDKLMPHKEAKKLFINHGLPFFDELKKEYPGLVIIAKSVR